MEGHGTQESVPGRSPEPGVPGVPVVVPGVKMTGPVDSRRGKGVGGLVKAAADGSWRPGRKKSGLAGREYLWNASSRHLTRYLPLYLERGASQRSVAVALTDDERPRTNSPHCKSPSLSRSLSRSSSSYVAFVIRSQSRASWQSPSRVPPNQPTTEVARSPFRSYLDFQPVSTRKFQVGPAPLAHSSPS